MSVGHVNSVSVANVLKNVVPVMGKRSEIINPMKMDQKSIDILHDLKEREIQRRNMREIPLPKKLWGLNGRDYMKLVLKSKK